MVAGSSGDGFPVWNLLLGYASHVLLSFVPSANFLVYCLVGNKFRSNIIQHFCFLETNRLFVRRIGGLYLRKVLHLSPPTRAAAQPRPGSLRSSFKVTALTDITRNKTQ